MIVRAAAVPLRSIILKQGQLRNQKNNTEEKSEKCSSVQMTGNHSSAFRPKVVAGLWTGTRESPQLPGAHENSSAPPRG